LAWCASADAIGAVGGAGLQPAVSAGCALWRSDAIVHPLSLLNLALTEPGLKVRSSQWMKKICLNEAGSLNGASSSVIYEASGLLNSQ